MGICPNCGSWVDEGDICMSCGGASFSGGNDSYSGSYSGRSSYGGYRPPVDREQINRRRLNNKKDDYERKLKEARDEKNDERRIKYYGEALDCARQYFEESERLGITVDGMPDRDNLLSRGDVGWISKKHYDEHSKLHILSTDQTENLENILKESGNGHIIRSNEDAHRARAKENARKWAINDAKRLNEDYFRHIEKANELALKNKPRHAIKEYQKAISTYERFFESRYAHKGMVRKMPEKSLTPDAVDHILEIYKKTHPLLTSNRIHAKINGEIIDMLSGDWDVCLGEADREVEQILKQKNLERQKRKEKVENIGAEVIAGAHIVANGILNRFK